jgi:hypothetical protein
MVFAEYKKFAFPLQSNSVITNNLRPAIFVCYNRVSLCCKMTNLHFKSVRYNRVLINNRVLLYFGCLLTLEFISCFNCNFSEWLNQSSTMNSLQRKLFLPFLILWKHSYQGNCLWLFLEAKNRERKNKY